MPLLSEFAERVAIVVSSCDAFFDAWQPFAKFFERFWNDCPFEVILLTNRLSIHSARIRHVAIGEDRGWSSNLLAALAQMPHSHVLYFQEDYFLDAAVRTEQLAEDFAYVITSGADSLCFRARSEPDRGTERLNDRFGIVPLNSDGRTRCQVTLWKRSALQSILRPGETAWDFEARGSARTQEMTILSYSRRDNAPISYLMSAISRGLWMPEAIALCREHTVEIEPRFRPLFSHIPWRRRLRRTLGRSRLRRALRRQDGRPVQL
ncbi:MAG: hypothetical protein ABI233_05555 [Chthoniobacterales bacterium]